MRVDPRANIGDALRQVREARGLTLEQVADITRVRSGYLAAIEQFDFAALPSRPFALGYVRAYAQAVGLDADAAVSRFKAEAPGADSELHGPIGVRHNQPKRFGALAGVAGALVVALIGWNVARHAMAQVEPSHPAVKAASPVHPKTVAVVAPAAGPSQIGAPLPPPPEADTPRTYQTVFAPSDAPPSTVDAPGSKAPPVNVTVGGTFVASGPVYGAAEPGSGLILKAHASTSLVVRGPGGAVYFARQLAAGESWRAPAIKGLTVEASAPGAVESFKGGISQGVLSDASTPLSKYGV